MGNDGGTIAKRQDILSLHSQNNNEQKYMDDDAPSHRNICFLSSLPLYDGKIGPGPVVGDYKGHLYLKEKLLEYLIGQKTGQSEKKIQAVGHITSFNDVIDVNIEWEKTSEEVRMVCPITKDLKTSSKFAYLRTCGCLLSYKLLKEISMKQTKFQQEILKDNKQLTHKDASIPCPKCEAEFDPNVDIVILNLANDAQLMAINMASYKLLQYNKLTHCKKPESKKRNKRQIKEGSGLSKKVKVIKKLPTR